VGDPKFPRKQYDRPSHPWEGERIKAENELLAKYGLKNKKELWRSQSLLAHFRERARTLQALVRAQNEQAGREREQLLRRLGRMGILPPEGATLDDVLALNVEAVLGRRLQTLVYVKGLANTPRQGRQFIVHGHMAVRGRRVDVPGYLVRRDEEDQITYDNRSPVANDMHPARPGAQAAPPPLSPEAGPDAESGDAPPTGADTPPEGGEGS
jgi:small subunit ribosomal protein S4